MGIFDDYQKFRAKEKAAEEAAYAQALREMDSGIKREGLWAMALERAEFDLAKASAIYLRLRAEAIKTELPSEKPRVPTVQIDYSIKSSKSPTRTTPNIPKTSQHTSGNFLCNECGYNGKLLVVSRLKWLILWQDVYVCPACGNRDKY